MVDEFAPDQSTHVTVPNSSKNQPPLWFIGLVILLLISIPIVIGSRLASQQINPTPKATNPQVPDLSKSGQFTEKEFKRGWYWGDEQKLPATPEDYVYTQIGDKGCWHLPAVTCQ